MLQYPGLTNQISGNTAGATAYLSTGTVVIAGGNNVTLSQNGNSITISGPNVSQYLTTAALSNQVVNSLNGSTGQISLNVGSSLSASTNGSSITFGLASNITTALQSAGAYLTTAALSNHSHNLATTTTNGSLIVVGTTNSLGATIAVPAYLTTAQPTGAYLTTARASNDAIGLNSAITQNGVSMTANSSGLSLNFPAFLTTAALSNHSHNFATTTTNGSLIVVATTNSNGATIAVPPYLTTAQPTGAYLTTARASNDGVGLNTAQSNVTWTVNSSGLSFDARGYAGTGFTGTNATATLNSNGLQLSVAGGGVINQTGPNISAGSDSLFTSGTVTFGNAFSGSFVTSNGSVVYSNAFLTTARRSTDGLGLATAGTNITWTANSNGLSINAAGYAGTGTTETGAAAFTLDSNGLQFNGASLAGVGTSATNASITLNSNGLAISVAAPGGGGVMQGGFTNIAYFTNTVTLGYINSTSHLVPFWIPEDISFDYIRFQALPVVSAASTTAATTGGATFSCGYTKSHFISIFSMVTGANSDSLQLYKSTGFTENFSNNIACAANSTQFSYSNRWTLPCSSGNYGFTYDYSSSAGSINQNSANVTGLTGTKFVEIPFGTSLPAGRYWLGYGASTTTAVQSAGTTIGVRNAVSYNLVYVSQAAQSIGTFGAATSNIYGPQQGLGSFTTVGGATTNSLHWTKVTVSANHPMLSFNLMRSA